MSLIHALSQKSRLVIDADRRQSIRIEPPSDAPLPAQLRDATGEWQLSARVCRNVGLGGIAVRLTAEEAERMRQQETMHLKLHLTGGKVYEFDVRVCYVLEMAPGTDRPHQVGVEFLPSPDLCAAVIEIYGYLAPMTDLWR
jgi:hypothetical protein